MSILDWLLTQLEASNGDTVSFTARELLTWPNSDRDLLQREGLIKRATTSTHTICPGCENNAVVR